MSDCISRQAAIDAVMDVFKRVPTNAIRAKEVIEQLPSVPQYTAEQVQKMQELEQSEIEKAYELGRELAEAEIIRCKDCRWREGSECVRFADVRPFPDDFCSRAERREDG